MANRSPDPIRALLTPPATIADGDVATWDAATKSWVGTAPGAASVADASTTVKGKVELATDGEVAAGLAVQANDGRLSNARMPTTHGHAEGDVTGLVADLAAKATPADVASAVSAHEAAVDPHVGYQRESEKAAANGYASLGADGKVPSAQLPASGGADPWTVVKLASPFATTSSTPVAVTGLKFTPAAGKTYIVYGGLLLRTATATVGPRPGLNWPSGLTRQGAVMEAPSTATAQIARWWGPTTAGQNAADTGLPDATNDYYARFEGLVVAGASPSGDVQVTLASETAGTTVTAQAGSYLMFREI